MNVIKGNHFSIKTLIRIWTNYNYEKTLNVFIIIMQKCTENILFNMCVLYFFAYFTFPFLLNFWYLIYFSFFTLLC